MGYVNYLIMHTCNDYLYTSDMQFGFKPQHSTTMCSLVYHEIINHYMSNNSNVYSCLLDASKAFDKVHYGKLFHILLNRKVPFCIIRLLMDSFERQRARVMWNSHVSDYFSISNGVKQGGVISPVLFNLYLDNLLISLKQSGLGCHINGTYMGALGYADDITLTCPSLYGLNSMLDICNQFAKNNHVIFNTKKTICIKYGDAVKPQEYAKLNDTRLSWKFNEITLLFIFSSFLWRSNSDGFKKYVPGIQWNKSVRKNFELPNNTHRWILGPLLNQPHISHQLYIRDVKFIYRLLNCHNCIVKECLTVGINNSNTIIGYKLAFIRSRFGINVIDTRYDVCLHNIIGTQLTV